MALLDFIKMHLRISSTDFDEEVDGLINAAISDLSLSGVGNLDEDDPLIKRAIATYCKAHFGYDNPDAERFQQAYDMLKTHLSLSSDYQEVVDDEI